MLDADPKAIQKINFSGNLNRRRGATMFFVIGELKETTRNCEILVILILYSVMHKFRDFVKPLLIIHQLILNCQKLNCIKYDNQRIFR